MAVEADVRTCEEARKRLKPFLDDLLSEGEYRAVITHLDTCRDCERHFRLFGDLSNQVWKLGKVAVPSDLAETAFFRVERARATFVKPAGCRSRTLYAVSAFLILLMVSLVALTVSKLDAPPSAPAEPRPPIVESELLRKAPGLETSAGETPEPAAVPARRKNRKAAAPEAEAPAPAASAPPIRANPVHWHLVYESDDARLTKQELFELRQKAKAVDAEARALEANQAANIVPEEADFTESRPESKRLREAAIRRKLLDALESGGVRVVSRPTGLFLFTGSADSVQKSMERVLSLSEEAGSFQDYTSGVAAEGMRAGSIYLERTGEPPVHWHVKFQSPAHRGKFLDAVREFGGSVIEDADALAVFSLPRTQLENLRRRIRAMRAEAEEFGVSETGSVLSNADETVSAYFL